MWKKIFGGGKTAREEKAPANQNPLYDRINWQRLPRHVAIIMDGNGRWAQGKGLIRTAGHKAGVKTLKNILKAAIDLRIEALTVYAFSTENWKRPRPEVEFLMKLFSEYLIKELEEMNDYNVRIRFIGRMEGMPEGLQRQMREAEALMKDNTGIRFNVAANYGGQDELIRAAQSLARKAAAGEIAPEDIDAEAIDQQLDTAGDPPVDLVIRTSGDQRLSNFLLWQSAYAEFYFTDVNWPDFTPACFVDALVDFAGRDRRFGGLTNK
ncbi:MAG: isoprenyl transferase [Mitsuokella jalaludinii]|jgi:undecaprenyl diphosphate synthase|uniref:Isoprenyl transferase n=1 Tax=Mitsuokella jalaludinii TaxID=187979 RepID=A0A174AT93_9FIRM|nr:isoprenyl transferase [Mitsuokella jalaludinii]MCI6612247.1 isoprenyl transferase [Mitsuokella jalaludinii]MCI7062990.1 isoprenyl transferase [Mitsuokella jalaludinii]MCI7186208.1 isoprenyl transferase [Mitsuokella jalaludinii]MCQ1533340.1 isoprenyl transferase [Mitsuokella jalaludinii]MDY5365560.1 isoprenyl transferase [Mitsuokella jalaludinii]